ncbi:hypothetical protein [Streptomyces xantholiticus]|uniref:hypothetical protein n=1 Tax=Streptomyces xantholiticus TaxID=68285 RepID=UPI0016784CFE|nr:hypothetical protein [Streptomyces xantholiticus]GGW27468.1 hypothetical protein GCM10010381_09650 [Streptomyces xantholiticus]
MAGRPHFLKVWTPEPTGQFLDFVKDDWLYELWRGFIFLGPRRGERAALPWRGVSTTPCGCGSPEQIVEVACKLYGEAPKADSVRALRATSPSSSPTAHGARQPGEAWAVAGQTNRTPIFSA